MNPKNYHRIIERIRRAQNFDELIFGLNMFRVFPGMWKLVTNSDKKLLKEKILQHRSEFTKNHFSKVGLGIINYANFFGELCKRLGIELTQTEKIIIKKERKLSPDNAIKRDRLANNLNEGGN